MNDKTKVRSGEDGILWLMLLVVIGYLPWGVPILFIFLGDYFPWGMEYWNETAAWAVILGVSHLAATVLAFRLIKQHPAVCICAITFAAIGIALSVYAWVGIGFSQSSKQDSLDLELAGFWLDGGWIVAAILLIPTILVYALTSRNNRIYKK